MAAVIIGYTTTFLLGRAYKHNLHSAFFVMQIYIGWVVAKMLNVPVRNTSIYNACFFSGIAVVIFFTWSSKHCIWMTKLLVFSIEVVCLLIGSDNIHEKGFWSNLLLIVGLIAAF